jgi:hypothetical protein
MNTEIQNGKSVQNGKHSSEPLSPIPETNEDLREKLRNKINSKRNIRVNKNGIQRKTANKLGDKTKKLVKFLQENEIRSEENMTEDIISKVYEIISKDEMKKIFELLKDNDAINDELMDIIEKLM